MGAASFAACVSAQSNKTKSATSRPVTVHDLRIGVHAEKTRIVIDMDGPVRFQRFALIDPYRIVLDLPEVLFKARSRKFVKPSGGVSGYRFGLFQPGTSRVVIDLVEPRVIEAAFELPPRNNRRFRVVLDLKKVSRQAFLTSSTESIRRRLTQRRREAAPVSKAPLTRHKPRQTGGRKMIVLDPGHGGVDPGAIGASGIYEKTVVLAAAKTLKRILETSGRYTVKLTRERDVFLKLRQRVASSRAADADLFISIHADSIADKKLRGASVYTLSEKSSDKEAARLAEQENKSDIIAGMDFSDETPEVTNILIDLVQRETKNRSARLAGILAEELRNSVKTHRRAHRFAGFAVLKAPDVPSVLLEMGYLSNPKEEKMLRSRAFQEKVAVAVRRGIDKYFKDIQSAQRVDVGSRR
ncbi:MAG: N-acetylmuramoyl-L-alanine amidase [Rhodospirillaceae bacterium]|nr:N-acetylmuramoyl-L-alanine amidase [Rhodospirillaceae bacterium]